MSHPYNNKREHLLAIRNTKEILSNHIAAHQEDELGGRPKNIYKDIAKYANRVHNMIEDFKQTYGSYTDGMENKI